MKGDVRALLSRAAKWVLYPIFYLGALLVCFYFTFPWDRLKDRVVAEFAKSQEGKGDKSWRLEIGSMSGYWLTGVEIEDAKIVIPPDEDPLTSMPGRRSGVVGLPPPSRLGRVDADGDGDGAAKSDGAKTDGKGDEDKTAAKDKKPAVPTESAINFVKAHAHVRILPLLIGRVRVDFEAETMGGSISGTVPVGGGTLEVNFENINLAQVSPLRDLVSLPVKGVANGKLELTSDGAKWTKSTGSLDLTVANVVLGDGKAKFLNKVTLPPAQLGNLEIAAKCTDGILKFDKFGATGKDVTVVGEGFIKIKEPWDTSTVDVIIRFGFSDEYKAKDDKTIALFGDPKDPNGSPGLIDLDPKVQPAKRDDGMFGYHGTGTLKKMNPWKGTKSDSPAKPAATSSNATGADSSEAAATPTSTSTSHKHHRSSNPEPFAPMQPPPPGPGGASLPPMPGLLPTHKGTAPPPPPVDNIPQPPPPQPAIDGPGDQPDPGQPRQPEFVDPQGPQNPPGDDPSPPQPPPQ